MKGLLVRQVQVQLVDLSLSGCLLETTHEIQPGSTGELHVTLQGTEYRDAVNVIRASERRGSHRVAVGGVFTWHQGAGSMPVPRGLQTIVPARPRAI